MVYVFFNQNMMNFIQVKELGPILASITFWLKNIWITYEVVICYHSAITMYSSPIAHHSVLVKIWIIGSYPDQRLPQHDTLYPIGLKSARIEIPHIRSHYIDFSKTDFTVCENSFTIITFKLILLSKKAPNV